MKEVNEGSKVSEIIDLVIKGSDTFERLGRTRRGFEAKKRYIQENYRMFKELGESLDHVVAAFTTGYPGYDLSLAEIDEQYRYNNELLKQVQTLGIGNMTWKCGGCLIKNYHKMPNLKQVCYPCTLANTEIKPRKILNRLPDMDMWYVFDDTNLESGEKECNNSMNLMQEILTMLPQKHLYTSDINPIRAINDIYEISTTLANNKIPNISLPVDIHIVGLNYLKSLINQVPMHMFDKLDSNSMSEDLKINPISLRKNWEFDPEGYNFVYDFLASFTVLPLSKSNGKVQCSDAEKGLINLVNLTRKQIVEYFDKNEILKVLYAVSNPASKRRFETNSLIEELNKKFDNWKSGNFEKGNWILETPEPFGFGK